MNTSTHIRSGRHCVFNMHVHLVFVTKYRKACFSKEHLTFMKKVFESVCTDFEAKLMEFDGEKDHVHLLIHYPPKVSISNTSEQSERCLQSLSKKTLYRSS